MSYPCFELAKKFVCGGWVGRVRWFLGRGPLILCFPSPPPYHPLKNKYKLKYK